jgi:hypothetical protein
LAQSGPSGIADKCPLSEEQRTSHFTVECPLMIQIERIKTKKNRDRYVWH